MSTIHYGSNSQAECGADDGLVSLKVAEVTCQTCRGWLPIVATRGRMTSPLWYRSTKYPHRIIAPSAYSDGEVVATVVPNGSEEVNARLISAAPELLEALKTATRTIRTWHGMGMGAHEAQAWALYQASPEMQQINAAIAKAEGANG